MRRRGTGLGLWIVRAIVEAHDGTVVARSAGAGQGATFRIELPVLEAESSPSSGLVPGSRATPEPGSVPVAAAAREAAT